MQSDFMSDKTENYLLQIVLVVSTLFNIALIMLFFSSIFFCMHYFGKRSEG